MKKLRLPAAFAALPWAPGMAGAAESWNLLNEEEARFEAEVVDVICELTGDCAERCGGGERQLGLIDGEGTLILPAKNFTLFTGTSLELYDFCGQQVEVDGFFVWKDEGPRVYFLQFVRPPGGDWRRANRYLSRWAEREGFDPDGEERKRWYKHDPRVRDVIERDGFLGLGAEADREFLENN